MRSVEVTATTREEAIDEALEQLSAERHQAQVEVLEAGSNGFLGLGKRQAKVRVTVEDDEPTRGDRGSRDDRGQGEDRSRGEDRGRRDGRGRGGRSRGRGRGTPKPREEKAARPREEKAPREQRTPKPAPRDRERDRDRERPAPVRAVSEPVVTKPVDHEGAALMEELIGHMGMEGQVKAEADEEGTIYLKVESPDSAILIGRKGRNLEAMQYLINRMVTRNEEGEQGDRILVDVEGYQDRRRASLEEMALRYAERVKESGRRMRSKPLSAGERRVIHVVLQEDPDIRTFSVGDSSARSVVVAPKDEAPRRDDNDRPRRPRGGQRRGGRRPRGRGDSAPRGGETPARDARDS
jgi:spoIIIJ-associated protein